MNPPWEPPTWLREKVKKRDKNCVYCGIELKEYPNTKGCPNDKATLEHINNKPISEEWNLAMCCQSCNASKKRKEVSEWLKSNPFERRDRKENLAPIIKEFLKNKV